MEGYEPGADSVAVLLHCEYPARVRLDKKTRVAEDADKDEEPQAPRDLTLKIAGVLRISVAWDDSHPLAAGQRISISFWLPAERVQ